MIDQKKLKELSKQLCAECNEPLPAGEKFMVSLRWGDFRVFHNACFYEQLKKIPLSEENPEWLDEDLPGFKCQCGATGQAHELLCEPDHETLYCPVCGAAAWVWEDNEKEGEK